MKAVHPDCNNTESSCMVAAGLLPASNSPHLKLFSLPQDPVQLFILENLSFFLNCLTDGDRYQTFLQEVVAMVTRDCLSCVSLTRAVVKGLTEVVCGQEEVAQGSVQVTVAAATQLCVGLSAALGGLLLGGVMSELRQVLTYLMDAAVWDGLAAILASSAMEVCVCVCVCVCE